MHEGTHKYGIVENDQDVEYQYIARAGSMYDFYRDFKEFVNKGSLYGKMLASGKIDSSLESAMNLYARELIKYIVCRAYFLQDGKYIYPHDFTDLLGKKQGNEQLIYLSQFVDQYSHELIHIDKVIEANQGRPQHHFDDEEEELINEEPIRIAGDTEALGRLKFINEFFEYRQEDFDVEAAVMEEEEHASASLDNLVPPKKDKETTYNGKLLHWYIQQSIKFKNYNLLGYIHGEAYKILSNDLHAVRQFVQFIKGTEGGFRDFVGTEVTVGSVKYGVGGQIDCIFQKESQPVEIIVDWKLVGGLFKEEYFTDVPLNDTLIRPWIPNSKSKRVFMLKKNPITLTYDQKYAKLYEYMMQLGTYSMLRSLDKIPQAAYGMICHFDPAEDLKSFKNIQVPNQLIFDYDVPIEWLALPRLNDTYDTPDGTFNVKKGVSIGRAIYICFSIRKRVLSAIRKIDARLAELQSVHSDDYYFDDSGETELVEEELEPTEVIQEEEEYEYDPTEFIQPEEEEDFTQVPEGLEEEGSRDVLMEYWS